MPFDHAAATAQIAANIAEIGEGWAVDGLADPVAGIYEEVERPDGFGGIAYDLRVTVVRASLGATLPAENATVTRALTGEAYRLAGYRAGRTAGTIVLVLSAALR